MAKASEVLHVAQAINQGFILLEDLVELASRDDATEDDAFELLQHGLFDIAALGDMG